MNAPRGNACPDRINAYEVGLVPLSLRLAIRRDDRLEKRSQNRLLKAGD